MKDVRNKENEGKTQREKNGSKKEKERKLETIKKYKTGNVETKWNLKRKKER